MKKILSFILLSLLCIYSFSSKEKKAVVIIVDGVPNDVIERLQLPVFKDIVKTGSYGKSYVGGEVGSYTETPTISAVGYNTMLTGTWVNKHNVYGNNNMKPNYNYWTMFRIAKEQNKPTTTGIFSSWTDNRTILLGENRPENNNLQIDYIYDGCETDTIHFPHKAKDLHIFDYDEAVSKHAAECIRTNAPTFSWVYLWYTDDAGHIAGNGSYLDEYVQKASIQIDRIWQAIKYRQQNFNEDWMIIVTTDHGRTNDGYHHGKQSWRERLTWIATNQKVTKRFKQGECAMVDINPTICSFLNFIVPDKVRMEQDGLSFYGTEEIKNMSIVNYDDEITITWKAIKKTVPVTIYVALANEYQTTGDENWIKLVQLPASAESYKLNLGQFGSSKFYKFAIVSPHNSLNRWLKN